MPNIYAPQNVPQISTQFLFGQAGPFFIWGFPNLCHILSHSSHCIDVWPNQQYISYYMLVRGLLEVMWTYIVCFHVLSLDYQDQVFTEMMNIDKVTQGIHQKENHFI